MPTIKSDSWAEFTAQVAAAVAAGEDVKIRTGPRALGGYAAVYGDPDEALPEPKPPKPARPRPPKKKA